MTRLTKILAIALSAVVFGLVAFTGGFIVSQVIFLTDNVRTHQAQNAELTGSLSEMFNIMQQRALDPPSETTATVGALNGLLQSNNDRYARFLDAEEMQRYDEGMQGHFGGIGVTLGEQDGTTFILEVMEGTPAEAAGLKAGDYFYGVDDEFRDDWISADLSTRVRGEVGTDVFLTMVRPFPEGEMPSSFEHHLGDPFEVTITRDIIESPVTLVEMFDDNVGYVRLFTFNLRATEQLSEDIEGLIADGATSLILDLRDNPGGDLNQAIAVTSLFIESGPVVQIEEAGIPEATILNVTGRTLSEQLPLVVIVNGQSASASEIVSGAIQDHERGIVVGTNTFGKASVQTQIPFRDGAAFMTTAHYLTAKGRVIDDAGTPPDIEVDVSMADRAEFETDTQLQRAIEEAAKKAQ